MIELNIDASPEICVFEHLRGVQGMMALCWKLVAPLGGGATIQEVHHHEAWRDILT